MGTNESTPNCVNRIAEFPRLLTITRARIGAPCGEVRAISKTDTAQPQQRRWERYQVKIRTKVTLNKNGETSSFYGEASDVSQGGLRLFMPRDLEPGIIVLLEFPLPYNSRVMAIRGLVRNRSGFSYGVEFMRPTVYQQETMIQLCKTLQLLL